MFDATVPEHRRRELRSQIEACFGPHVGSYHNKVFKRFMYATELLIVLFFDSAKIDRPVVAGRCHYILDSCFEWEKFLNSHPVAFCIGCGETSEPGVMDRDAITVLLIARSEKHKGIGSFEVYVEDADALYAELVANGAQIEGPPISHPWGLRDFKVADLEGNRITFAQRFE